jgi:hypothetical protein
MNKVKILDRKLKKVCEDICKIVEEARKIWPEACIYCDGSNVNLLSGAPHDETVFGSTKRTDRILATVYVPNLDGGGW